MLNLGTGELVVIGAVALIVIGPERLPQVARSAGKAMSTLANLRAQIEDEARAVLLDDRPPPTPPPSP